MAKQKNLNKEILKEVSKRAVTEAQSKRDFIKSSIFARLVSFIPARFTWLVPFIADFKAKQKLEEEKASAQSLPSEVEDYAKVPTQIEPLYQKYSCVYGNPLICAYSSQSIESNQARLKYCSECDFPAILPEKAEIRGSRGRYRIEGLFKRRGFGRLYKGVQVSNSQPVFIKEYLLPKRYFNQDEAEIRKQVFKRVAGVNLADSRNLNFRISQPWEAITDANEERCYLLTKNSLDLNPTLKEYLASNGPMNAQGVYQVLNQVLQTLEFLHTQKFSLPSGQIQYGLVHGNLSLDTLLIVNQELATPNQEEIIDIDLEDPEDSDFFWNNYRTGLADSHFFIYLCDLALWESLFDPSSLQTHNLQTHNLQTHNLQTHNLQTHNLQTRNLQTRNSKQSKDLVDLGYVAFYLLAGGTINPTEGKILNPKNEEQWSKVDPEFKKFILRLLGLDVSFASAATARQALLNLPPLQKEISEETALDIEEEQETKNPRILFLLLGFLSLLLLGGLTWFFISKPQSQLSTDTSDNILLKQIKEVPNVPSGNFKYTSTKNILPQKKYFINKFEQKLKRNKPKYKLNYINLKPGETAIEKVKSGEVDFAITSLVDKLPPEVDSKEIAYDGLVVFVAYSYSNRENSLPQTLNGRITFEQLRKLYFGKIDNWQEKPINASNIDVRLYATDDNEVVQIFEQKVLQAKGLFDRKQKILTKQTQSNRLVTSVTPSLMPPTINRITSKYGGSSFAMLLQRVYQEFEDNNLGAIAFGKLSQVFGQCSVYPLALVDGDKEAIQPLIQDNGQPVKPKTDLCEDKGSYYPNTEVFKTGEYPLAYPLAIVYLKDNSLPPVGEKFADMLRTKEGQKLLKEIGLVSLYQIK